MLGYRCRYGCIKVNRPSPRAPKDKSLRIAGIVESVRLVSSIQLPFIGDSVSYPQRGLPISREVISNTYLGSEVPIVVVPEAFAHELPSVKNRVSNSFLVPFPFDQFIVQEPLFGSESRLVDARTRVFLRNRVVLPPQSIGDGHSFADSPVILGKKSDLIASPFLR